MTNQAEDFWDQILSRNPVSVQQAYSLLDHETQAAVQNHLQEMCAGTGWQDEQRISAAVALESLGIKVPRHIRKHQRRR